MNVLTHKEAKLAWANNEALLINNPAVNGWEEFFPANWGCDVFDTFQFQIKPRIVLIGNIEVPEPIKEPLNKGQQYFVPSLLTDKLANQLKWKNSATDKTLLERGLVHLSEDDAICHAQAHIIVSGGAIQRNDNSGSIDEIVLFRDQTTQNETVTDDLQTTSDEPLTELSLDHQELLSDLLSQVDRAQTPNEVTALSGYTTSWTEQQRKPLLDKIHKRLVELNPISAIPKKEAPSLMVRIENAPDLVTLSELEIEVKGRHPDIQPKLMGCVKKRRFELEN